MNISIIGVDRPGFGLSAYKPGRKILDWPNDVSELADTLRIEEFAVVGFSGGGPYALACAYKISERLSSCAIISGVGKMSFFVSFLSAWMPWIMLPLGRKMLSDIEKAKETLQKASKRWPEPDRECLNHARVHETMAESLVEGLSAGSRGAALDGGLIGRDFGFSLSNINFPKLSLWHGELDGEIPVSVGRDNARRLQNCNAKFLQGEAHISVIVNYGKEILTELIMFE